MTETVINPNDGFVSITAVGGETNLDFDFPIYEKTHLRIVRTRSGTNSDLSLNTDYTIADDQLEVTAGGTAVLSVAATAGDVYSLLLDVPEGRTTDFNQAGDFRAYTVNRELDLQTQMIQGLRRDADKSARLPDDSTLSSITLPNPEENNLIGWNSTADGLENKVITDASTTVISAFMSTLLDDSTASEARTTLGATLTNLGVSSYAQTILDDTTAGSARTTLDAEQKASSLTGVSPATGDYLLISDVSDSGNSKKTLVSDLLALGVVKAWVNFDGSGTTIRASVNVSSVLHGATGYHGVNFTNALADINYCPTITTSPKTATRTGAICSLFSDTSFNFVAPTTGGFVFTTADDTSTLYDPSYCCVIVIR